MADSRIAEVWDREVTHAHEALKDEVTFWATSEILEERKAQIERLEFALEQRRLARVKK